MDKLRILPKFFFLVLICFSQNSCQKKGSVQIRSDYGTHKSHNFGRVCMNCHNVGGNNDRWYYAAGSIYKPDLTTYNPNSTVYFYSGRQPNGQLVYTLPVDGNGNLYTTDKLDFSKGLWVGLMSASQNVMYMPDSITDGNCNHCHDGTTNPRIWIAN